jgi:AcrR family transcriptional regulator
VARPRSEDKRNAILAAATQVIAEQGLAAPTARIAKLAGVAEGSLFTYFSSKDELLNQLYVELKSGLKQLMLDGYPRQKGLKERMWHIWQKYVNWGVVHPHERKALAQLNVSDRITGESHLAVQQAMGEIGDIVSDSIAAGLLREHPPAFVSAMLGALAEATMEFMAREPGQAEQYAAWGFEALWRAIVSK